MQKCALHFLTSLIGTSDSCTCKHTGINNVHIYIFQVLGPLSDDVLAYMDQWDGTTKVEVTVPSLAVTLSPATVRLILNSVRSLNVGEVSEQLSYLADPQCVSEMYFG